MTFARKIFLGVVVTTICVGSLLLWATYFYMSHQAEEKFVSRYSIFTEVLASTLTRLDLSTEDLMLNAAKVIQGRDAKHGLLSTSELKGLLGELKMTHIFVADSQGRFVRSTNEDPKLIPNLFSFCDDYKKLVLGTSSVEATPIIKPDPEPKPFKFLSIPSYDRKRIIEVGVRADFIAKTLTEATTSDDNVMGMSLYGPDGTQFGKYDSDGVVFEESKTTLPSDLSTIRDNGNSFSFFSKVKSSHPKCCQCDKSGTSRNGEYYYVLESKVSKSELRQVLASTGWAFLGLGVVNILLALFLGRIISRRLVKNIEFAASKIQKMKMEKNFTERIRLGGKDEVAFLTNEFDRLLDDLGRAQDTAIESERLRAKMQLSREVAHNIKSPVHAIEIMLPTLTTIPQRVHKVLSDSVREIKGLAQKLKKQSEGGAADNSAWAVSEVILAPTFLDEIVERKILEYSARRDVEIVFDRHECASSTFIKAEPIDLRSILSNLINNAVEAAKDEACKVMVSCAVVENQCLIQVKDNGVGIPPELVSEIGRRRITFKGDSSRGLGLTHAFEKVEGWGGKITIESKVGFGSTISIYLPLFSGASLGSRKSHDISWGNAMSGDG